VTYVPRSYVEKYWLPSFGEKLHKIHFREPPPGTRHAECDPESELCEVHFDRVNPYQDLIGHLVEDSPQTLIGLSAGIMVGSIVYSERRNVIEALVSAFVFGTLSYGIAKLLLEPQ
jgi:hypothetical protein